MHSKYLIVGSSHAALEAATAIRLIDADGALPVVSSGAMLTIWRPAMSSAV